jgi:hypothetical protein
VAVMSRWKEIKINRGIKMRVGVRVDRRCKYRLR